MLFSCASFSDGGEELSDGYEYTESDAIITLGSDMLDGVALTFDGELLNSALKDSYTAYKEYVPLYEEFKNDYLDMLSECVTSLIETTYPVIEEGVMLLSETPDLIFKDDGSLSDELYKIAFESVKNVLYSELSSYSGTLDAFRASEKEFMATRAVYANLATIGLSYQLPVPEKADLEIVAEVGANMFFSLLSERETYLKNRSYDPGSPYAFFWEGKNER